MNKLIISLAAIGLTAGLSSAAFAQDQASTTDFATVDGDHSGDISLVEATAVWAQITQDQLNTADTNGDGKIDEQEYTAYLAANPAAM